MKSLLLFAPALLLAVVSLPGLAALGGGISTVEADSVAGHARHSAVAQSAYTVHTLTSDNGALVNEYTNNAGVVFAVSWQSPQWPDLQQLLGTSFNVLQAENAKHTGRRSHQPMSVNRSDFVLQTGGHNRAFHGLAYLPNLLPAGVTSAALQ